VVPGVEWGSKDWANEQLRFAISVLHGDIVVSSDSGRIQLALVVKERLEDHGFWWQARILNCHLHRFQRDHRQMVVGLRRITR
jgi:hypothetical protein